MNWAWATSLDNIWRSPTFPMWLTLAAAGFFSIIVLITLLRAEKSVANGALTVITLLAIGIAVAANLRGFGPLDGAAHAEAGSPSSISASPPALSCIDDLAGEMVLTACEKVLFGSPDSAAAAVSRAGSLIARLTSLGDVATAEKSMTSELLALRRAIERDRYGLMAYVLAARDHCTASKCPAFSSLTDTHQVASNMDERVYEGLIMRYAPSWNAPASTTPAVTAFPAPGPIGKPTNAEFPTSSSTPAVSIMTPEPVIGTPRPPVASATAPLPAARPTTTAASTPPAAPKKKRAAPAPLQAAPVTVAPAASND